MNLKVFIVLLAVVGALIVVGLFAGVASGDETENLRPGALERLREKVGPRQKQRDRLALHWCRLFVTQVGDDLHERVVQSERAKPVCYR